mmetsp:Transcript_21693/g.42620  ORF Transcript_21693/g.42620 Transcript_21693/m.42620 type:complete len:221 (-) Transcript_21693:1269-1931(-)
MALGVVATTLVSKNLTEVLHGESLGLRLKKGNSGHSHSQVKTDANEHHSLKTGSTVHGKVANITKDDVGENVGTYRDGHTDTTEAKRVSLGWNNPSKRAEGACEDDLEEEDHSNTEELDRASLVISLVGVNVDASADDDNSNKKEGDDGEEGAPDGKEFTTHTINKRESNEGCEHVDGLERKIIGERVETEGVEKSGGVGHEEVDSGNVLGEGNSGTAEE